MTLIRIEHLTKSFNEDGGHVQVLTDVTVTFDPDATYAITGVSGAGKSTLLQLLAGIDEPDSGAVYYDERNIALLSQQELDYLHNKEIGLVFQQPYLIRELSVMENIMIPGLIGSMKHDVLQKRAMFLLDHVGLKHKAHEKSAALSGGQQQRVALARALFNKPTFLLADELTGNLDEKTGHAIIDLLLDCQQEWHMGLIVSSHDSYVVNIMQHLYQLRDGNLYKIK